jgi:hypothetical protein
MRGASFMAAQYRLLMSCFELLFWIDNFLVVHYAALAPPRMRHRSTREHQ